ncbi:MAG: hypothetical protein JST75_18045 [Bacteroidetes bacterium]|nr:hypothetical protein [Bacteroidota bacterium]
MKSRKHFFGLSENIDSLIAGAIGFFIIQVFSHHSGIGVSPDSVTYISTARNFYNGRGLIGFDNMPLVVFPALYPIFLAAINFITRLDPVVSGAVMNGLLFALLLYFCGAIMNVFSFFSRWYKLIILSCLVLSPSLLEVYSMLWSETLFILLTIFFMISMRNYFQKKTIPSLITLSIVVALACVTRYAGIALLSAGGMLIILNREAKITTRIFHVISYSIISSSLLFINIVRNISATGVATGVRQKGTTTLLQNIYYFGSILTDWLPFPKTNTAAFIVTVASFLICAIVFAFFLWKKAKPDSYECIAAAFCVVYIAFMLLSATASRYEQFTNRLLSPLFIPLVWSLSCWVPSIANKFNPIKKAGIVGLGLLTVAIFQNHQLAADYETYDGVKDAGIPGYGEDPFPQLDIVRYMQENKNIFKPKYAIYSNAGDAFYFFTGKAAQLLPQVVFPNDVQKFYAENHHYVVWFNDVDNPDLLSLQEVLKNKKMTLIQQFDSGAIYVYEQQ